MGRKPAFALNVRNGREAKRMAILMNPAATMRVQDYVCNGSEAGFACAARLAALLIPH